MLERRRCGAAATLILAASVVAGCSSDPDHSIETTPVAGQSRDAVAHEDVAEPEIDACSLLSAQDITGLLGVAVEGASRGAGCTWENPATYESIYLEIGGPNTAIGGTLAPSEPGVADIGTPGPDGMRMLGGGSVEFPADERANIVQVAVLTMLGDEANAAAIALARKVTAQLST